MKHRHSQSPLPPAEVGHIPEELELREETEIPGEDVFQEAPLPDAVISPCPTGPVSRSWPLFCACCPS